MLVERLAECYAASLLVDRHIGTDIAHHLKPGVAPANAWTASNWGGLPTSNRQTANPAIKKRRGDAVVFLSGRP
jgi:hypothetical protein